MNKILVMAAILMSVAAGIIEICYTISICINELGMWSTVRYFIAIIVVGVLFVLFIKGLLTLHNNRNKVL